MRSPTEARALLGATHELGGLGKPGFLPGPCFPVGPGEANTSLCFPAKATLAITLQAQSQQGPSHSSRPWDLMSSQGAGGTGGPHPPLLLRGGADSKRDSKEQKKPFPFISWSLPYLGTARWHLVKIIKPTIFRTTAPTCSCRLNSEARPTILQEVARLHSQPKGSRPCTQPGMGGGGAPFPTWDQGGLRIYWGDPTSVTQVHSIAPTSTHPHWVPGMDTYYLMYRQQVQRQTHTQDEIPISPLTWSKSFSDFQFLYLKYVSNHTSLDSK